MFGIGATPLWLSRALYAADAPSPRKKVLVAIFQRGAVDGLNVVVPYGEKRYYDLRPTIAIPAPERHAPTSAIDLDGFFGLHPSLAPLKPIYDAGHLAIVHAVGSPDPTRSHFDAQDYMESGTPGRKATIDGWLNRALPGVWATRTEIAGARRQPGPGAAARAARPQRCRGDQQSERISRCSDASAVRRLSRACTAIHARQGPERHRPRDVRRREADAVDSEAALHAGERREVSERTAGPIADADRAADQGGRGPGSRVHRRRRLGHARQRSRREAERRGSSRICWTNFGQALAAFYQDLGDRMADVAVVTMSEFGRTAKENGNRGTDHGHANVMFAFGGGIRGGKVYGDWPGLRTSSSTKIAT